MSVDFDRLKEVFLVAVEQDTPEDGRLTWTGRAETTRSCGPRSPASSPGTW